MKRLLALLPALLLSVPCASLRAQDPDEAARRAGEAISEKFQAFDPALCGTFWFRIRMAGKDTGTCKIVVEKAPADSGAACRVSREYVLTAAEGCRRTETLLDPGFSIVSVKEESTGTGTASTAGLVKEGPVWVRRATIPGLGPPAYEIFQPDINYPDDEVIVWKDPARSARAFLIAPKTRVEVAEMVDGDKFGTPAVMCRIRTADGREGWVPKPWVKCVPRPQIAATFRAEAAGRNYGDPACMWMLGRVLAPMGPGRYAVPEIRWPWRLPEGQTEMTLGADAVKTTFITVGEPKATTHQGKEISAVPLRFETKGDSKVTVMFVGPDRRWVSFGDEDGKTCFIAAASEEEAKADPEAAGREPKGGPDAELAIKVWKDFYRSTLEAVKAKREIKGTELQDKAARENGFKDWNDFAVKMAKSLGADEYKKVVDEVVKWYTAELEILVKEMTEEAAKGK